MWTVQGFYTLFEINAGSNTQENKESKATYLPSHKLSKKDVQDMLVTEDEVRTNS